MNVKYMWSLLAAIALFLVSYAGSEAGLQALFGIVIPYLAIVIFLAGVIWRVMNWARSPVPFRIPTTCGQQKSLPWIKQNKIDNPSSKGAVVLRMIMEILFFRSLFRNTRAGIVKDGSKISYKLEIWLWLGALAFHWSFFTVLARHMRFFLEPVPAPVAFLEKLDGFLQIGLPGILISGVLLLAGALFLLVRRIVLPHVRYISLAADYFPLFIILGIAISGIMMRYFTKIDVVAAKQLAMGLVTFHPVIPEGIGGVFFVHLFFVSVLLIYFPFSKLMHLGGVFLSPTRNLTADTRARRHVNPWNYPVHVHTYEEYEDDFREKMIGAGLPVEKTTTAEAPQTEEKE
ncbi:Hdr-like menaquinol oxidoreductase cytochrome b-like subunit [Candidatus Desulfarcum epimagneticum]|uniref:Hdr-like menaquinol oxidoreductase cytochrome b-like subunit n=1 Tax=uncultured Desulfobacteraceae bacterium TaxID=218296 RepID=A0A484HB99_9BACT|nr:Hdr-like menaquinol oxidoreductase cytochrome b-like subunit [uncultured Desulfobacteraceae bacterium]